MSTFFVRCCAAATMFILPWLQTLGQDETERTILPRFMTSEESLRWSSYPFPVSPLSGPPPRPVRAMAEYEELEGIVVRWAYNTFNLLLSQIVDAAQDEGKVWILVRPGTSDSTNIKAYLTSRGIPLTNLLFVSVATNSIWCRDYGPWTVYDSVTDSLAILDFRYNRPRPLDDVVPDALASLWGVPIYRTTQMPDSLVHTGGNFMVDGLYRGFASRLIENENLQFQSMPWRIDSIMSDYAGLTSFVRMNTLLYDGIHHIDMHMKLLDEETLLIGQYPVNISDYATIENTVNLLRGLTTANGRPYRIIRIPMPPDASGNYPPNSNYLTYTNSVIVNKTVLVPIYGLLGDSLALSVYRNALPGYRVLGFDCNAIIPSLGAIHCIVKEVGVSEPVHFRHARLWQVPDSTMGFRIVADISARTGIDSALLHWRSDTLASFQTVSLTDSLGFFVGHLLPPSGATRLWYYLSARTGSGRTVTRPLPGATGAYEVMVSGVTDVESMPTIPLESRILGTYPNPFNPATTVSYSIGEPGWVRLGVYDILGRQAGILFEGWQEVGSYTSVWSPNVVATGVYFIHLNVQASHGPARSSWGKAVLIR